MNLKTFFLLTISISVSVFSFSQKTYTGTLVTKLGQELTGEITVNLQGANDDLIKIQSSATSKNKGTKETTSTTASFNTAIIKYIIIDNTTYYFRNINTEYGKSINNVCVKLIAGTINCGIFECGDGKAPHSVAVKFPKSSMNELTSTDYYDESSFTVAIQVGDCKSLYRKILDKDEAVSWTPTSTREQRIRAYRNIITEFNSCQ
ncbi:MAG TPA: hypothetical protein VFV31_13090 [Chitinophagaceae bacterium]|nr:hypothetical protein [Chitinophagaceae bacterium]